jgi:hypothetical protein
LYREFPVFVDIDRAAIAKVLGVSQGNWGDHMLRSGRSFIDVLNSTIAWLAVDDYTRHAAGSHPSRVVLTTKGLKALNAVPSPLADTVGTELRKATERASGPVNSASIGDLIGSVIGGFTKSMGSG